MTTRSSTRTETFSTFMNDILPILVSEESLDVADVASLQQTCRSANNMLCSREGDELWKTLATSIWSDVGKLVSTTDGGGGVGYGDGFASNYRELFINYPRTWLTMEASKVKLLPKWSKVQHLSKHGGIIECGKCGCNCSNGSLCPGIPMKSTNRWERMEKKGYYECREMVPAGEGYQMSNYSMVAVNYFCETCFERVIELEVVKREDYDMVAGSNIFDETTE